jgi:hypothetical protein
MEHKIKYSYRTGDSFNTYDREEFLEIEWKDLNVAKEALKRIKEHYKWYKSVEDGRRYRDEPEVKQPVWWKVKNEHISTQHNLINLPLDNGKEIQMWCPWCGYFETLYGAEIVSGDTDMKFETGLY